MKKLVIKNVSLWILALSLLGPSAGFALNQQLVDQMNDNLAKTNTSIALTKDKIRSAKEIQFLPELYLSLAELLIEKSRIMYAIKLEKAGNRPLAEIDFSAEKRVKFDAIDALNQIENRYPKFKGLDRVILAIAEEYREMNENNEAMKAYKRLIDKFPDSEYWSEAQYGLGNIFYDKKDYEFALDQYKKIVSRPNAGAIQMMAHYKIGLCYLLLDKSLLSMRAFESVLSFKADIKNGKPIKDKDFERKDVREEALLASVKPISDLSAEDLRDNPKYRDALRYYLELAPSRAAYRAVLPRLAKRMVLKTRFKEAADVWLEVVKEATDESQVAEAIGAYFTSFKKSKRDTHDVMAGQLVGQRLWDLKTYGKRGEYLRFEPVLRDIATSYHKNAIKIKRTEDLILSIDSYKIYFWIYPTSKSSLAMRTNMAEAAFHGGRFVDAGIWYRDLARKVGGKQKREYLLSGIDSLNKGFEVQDQLDVLEKTQGRSVYNELAEEFQKLYPRDKETPGIRFNLGKTLYDGQDFKKAEVLLESFIRRHPKHEKASAAAILLLDCFYLRDDFKGLAAKGRQILTLNLDDKTKLEIQAIIKDSTFKRVRSAAGDFASQTYAKEFLKFAQEAGQSPLGESALLEAFVSLKSGTDLQAFKIGEQFLGQYGDSSNAKDVFINLIQMSLAATDFARAAKYLAAFAQRYPTDSSSSKYALTSAQLYELVGNADQASKVYFSMNLPERSADLYYRTQKWNDLAQVARKTPGIKGLYYQGIASYQLNQKASALELMERVIEASPTTDEEKYFWGHAGYLVSRREFAKYKSVAKNGVASVGDIKTKGTALADVDKYLWKTVDTGVGEWVIASLHLQAVLYRNYAAFLKRGPAPKPLSAEQYQKMVGPQVASYLKNSKELLGKCLALAEESEIFSDFVSSCRGESSDALREIVKHSSKQPVKQSASYAQYRERLLKEPTSKIVLDEFAQAAMKINDLATAEALYSRILELDANDANALARIGVIRLFESNWIEAKSFFKSSLIFEPRNQLALAGMTALFKKFDYKNKYSKTLGEAKRAGPPRGIIHPMMK